MRPRALLRWMVLSCLASAALSCRGQQLDATEASREKDPPVTGSQRDPWAESRRAMVERQLVPRGIRDQRVLQAMGAVPRHEFIPEALVTGPDGERVPLDEIPEPERPRYERSAYRVRDLAYQDSALPIGWDQTISQPYIVAFMTQHLDPKPEDKVLEIGTGSGYQAAVLSGLVDHVYSIEILEPLARRAKATLERLGYTNVTTRCGDGYRGWPEEAPFDAIIVTCAPESPPAPLIEQLREGGRLVIPAGDSAYGQYLYLLEKRNGTVIRRQLIAVSFVPMTGEAQQRHR